MKSPTLIFFLTLIFSPLLGLSQADSTSQSIQFRDTMHHIATDSLLHRFGDIPPTRYKTVKPFCYVGTDSVFIKKGWTGDPHYVCRYPQGHLIPGKVYYLTFCFTHRGKRGRFDKPMGIVLSDGSRVLFRFRGNVISEEEE